VFHPPSLPASRAGRRGQGSGPKVRGWRTSRPTGGRGRLPSSKLILAYLRSFVKQNYSWVRVSFASGPFEAPFMRAKANPLLIAKKTRILRMAIQRSQRLAHNPSRRLGLHPKWHDHPSQGYILDGSIRALASIGGRAYVTGRSENGNCALRRCTVLTLAKLETTAHCESELRIPILPNPGELHEHP